MPFASNPPLNTPKSIAASRSFTRHPRPLPVPTTFAGVAAIAARSPWSLLAWQLLVAALTSAVLVWGIHHTWEPAVRHAALALPNEAEVSDGVLRWHGADPLLLHQGSHLSIVVDSAGRRESGLASDVTLSIEQRGFAFNSLFGWLEFQYPQVRVPLGRNELSALLTAWIGPALLTVGVSLMMALLLAWSAMATLYSLVLGALAPLLRRRISLSAAWRLAAASLLPGALLMSAAVALYATRHLGWIGLLLALPGHLVVGWIYCSGGFLQVAAPRSAGDGNPFGTPPPAEPSRGDRSTNPFEPSSSHDA
jgi:hypothetical protein